jgi:predicted secreted protein
MGWFTGIAIYLTMWWVVLFAVLPLGVRSQAEAGEIVPGSDPGAPAIAGLKRKLVITTVVAAVLWCILALVIASGWVSLERPLGLEVPTGR